MRMIEADHREPRRPGVATNRNVIGRIEQIAVRVLGEVARLDGLKNLVFPAHQHAAALAGVRPLGVVKNRLEGQTMQFTIHNLEFTRLRRCKFQIFNCKFSTAIAIPIPPPIHNAATP